MKNLTPIRTSWLAATCTVQAELLIMPSQYFRMVHDLKVRVYTQPANAFSTLVKNTGINANPKKLQEAYLTPHTPFFFPNNPVK